MFSCFIAVLLVGAAPLAAEDRKDLPVEKALIGTWQTELGHATWYFGPGTIAIHDEGISIRGKWETVEKDEKAGTLRIRITEFDLGDHENYFTFAADRQSLKMSLTKDPPPTTGRVINIRKWLYVGSDTDPEPKRPPEADIPFSANKAREHQEAWARYWGVPVETTNSISMKLVLIPAGKYKPLAPGKDELKNLRLKWFPYYIGVTEVTCNQFQAVMGETPAAKGTENGRLPVLDATWQDAAAFCNNLSEKEGLVPAYGPLGEWRGGVGYRLPDDQEWEFACRAGTTTAYWFGDDRDQLNDHAWFIENSLTQVHRLGAFPVGERTANPFGLLDMHGNAAEWCEIVTDQSPYRNRSYLPRGGKFSSDARSCRSAYRNETLRATDKAGFRVVRWPQKVEAP